MIVRRGTCRHLLIAVLLFLAGPAFAHSPAPECDDAGATDGVGLKFCTWEQDGLWHFEVKVISGASETKAVSVACQLPDTDMVQTIEDAYEPGADRTITTGILPTSAARPSSHCAIESVADWVPSDSDTEEE